MMAWLLAGGSFAVLGLSAAAHWAVASDTSWPTRALRSYENRMDQHAGFLMLRHSGQFLARIHVAAVSVCLVLALGAPSIATASALLVLGLGPVVLLKKLHEGRVVKLERQLDSWLLILANALRSTPSLGDAIASTVALAPRPFNEEVDILVKELRLGMPLDRALAACSRRIGSRVVSSALMMIVVARQTGGDLTTTLERISSALRETARLEGVLRTKTAEGRGQVVVLALVPFLLCSLIVWLDRTWFDPMLEHVYGRAVLVACGAGWVTATLWAHHIAGTRL